MSRSVSAPSSVTKTSPCWNGLIVPGSTLRYGSNFCSCTRSPRAFKRRPSEAATMPFPSADTTPPVTKTYFGARALTGFQGSSGDGRNLGGGRTDEIGEPREHLRGEGAADAAEPGRLDGKSRRGLTVGDGLEVELDVDMRMDQLEDEAPLDHHLQHEQRPAELRPQPKARAVRPLDLPEGTRGEPAAHGGVDPLEPRPPVRESLRLGQNCPDLADRRRKRPASYVPRQGTPVRRASARAPP